MDKGPWEVRRVIGGWEVWSDDFDHDVALSITGDFEDDVERRKYAEWLCAKLNGTADHVPGE